MLTIREDDLSNQQSCQLIALHLAGMGANVPLGALFLNVSELQRPEVTVWSVWDGPCVAGIGALKMLSRRKGEIKSMRTHPSFTGRGVGSLILSTIIGAAKARGIRRLSLETGSGPSFVAAYSLYEKFGFRRGEAYSGHQQTEFNHFMHLDFADSD